MTLERQISKPEIASQKRVIKLPPAIGDWTTYKPPKILVKKVKSGLYGFDRLSKEELNLVMLIHYRFIQKLLKHLKVDLGMAVELFSIQVEQTTYLNFLRTLSGPTVQAKIAIPGLHETVSFIFALPLANSIINFSLGSRDLEPINRGLTEAENISLSTSISEYLPDYVAAFGNVIENVSFEIMGSPDIAIDPSINTSSTFVCFSAEVSLGDNPPGKIFIGYLGNTLKTLLSKYKRKVEQKPLDFSALPSSLLSKITIPISAKLGDTALTTREIHQFEIGDVVNLDTAVSSPIVLNIGKNLKVLCQPGTKDKKAVIRITTLQESTDALVAPPTLEEIKEIIKPPTTPQEIKKESPKKEEKKEKDIFDEDEFAEDDDLLDDFEDEDFSDDEL